MRSGHQDHPAQRRAHHREDLAGAGRASRRREGCPRQKKIIHAGQMFVQVPTVRAVERSPRARCRPPAFGMT